MSETIDQAAFLKSILESATEYSIIAKDLSGTILAWNEGARRIYGYEASEVVGKESAFILHDPDDVKTGRAQSFLDEARKTGKWEGDLIRVRKNGRHFAASVSITLRKDAEGRPIGYLLISKDITEQRILREQLRRKNEELEGQNRRVQEANRLKSEFLANMSHELRTPLNGIIGFTEFLSDEKPGPLNPKQREYLNDILSSGRHLLQLINDVLDLAKVESGKMELLPEAFSARKAIEEVCSVIKPLAQKKNISIKTSVAGIDRITLDQHKFKQVLYNLLSNAVKFSHEGDVAEIHAGLHDGNEIELKVKDRGIGIKKEDMNKLFVEFQQLDSSAARLYQGTGLGLALTKKLIDLQKGSINVESEFGKGSVFTVILPAALEAKG